MSKRTSKPKRRRTRRTYSEEFKREAVRMLIEQDLSLAEAAKNLDVNPNSLRTWKLELESEGEGALLSEDERMELARLRAENRQLRMERDILKKATAFFANEKN